MSLLGAIVGVCGEPIRAAGWRVEPDVEPSPNWIRVLSDRASPPTQGWKLHVSAAVFSAEAVLRRALPVLFAENASFKVVDSIRSLGHFNGGECGPSQVGKFITVYPNDEEQALRLAVALDQATRGLRGPAIGSDRALAPRSLVHYRYGGFDVAYAQFASGAVLPSIRTPDGELVPDLRSTRYHAPPWVTDPFIAAGVAPAVASRSRLIAERYLIVSTPHESPRGAVHLAVDLDDPQTCILKSAHRDAYLGTDGRDARDRLRHEADVLTRLAPDPRFPAVFGLLDQRDVLYLAMEEIEGLTLEAYVCEMSARGCFMGGAEVIARGQELAAILDTIHEKGFIYRDLKSPNVLCTPDGQLRVIDFEIAHERASAAPASGRGTRGYASPQEDAGERPVVADDVYGLGALLYFLATGAEPSRAPRPFALLDQPIQALNPAIGPGLADVIARCLEIDPERRFPSMKAVSSALTDVRGGASVPPAPFGEEPIVRSMEAPPRRFRELAVRLADSLCGAARRPPDGQGMEWISRHEVAGPGSRDINTGLAGTLLALAELASESAIAAHLDVLAEGARRLAIAPRLAGPFLPGLYVGEAGVGAALLRAGQVLDQGSLIDAAAEKGRRIAAEPHASPDLFNGTAGRARFHLLLWDQTGERAHLHDAIKAGESLLSAAEDAGDGGLRWTTPPTDRRHQPAAYLGYAHGAAGIGDVLLDLFDETGEERFLVAARRAGCWLEDMAVPVLDDDSGLGWPATPGAAPAGAFWCHGAAGIGRFFLHLARSGRRAADAALAGRAARMVARGGRSIGTTQCHGLAGSIELLVDMFQETRDRAYLREAHALARLLEPFGVERDGALVWPSESPAIFSPDYMVGYAGVAVCLLRLSAPERLPHSLSRAGFRPKRGPLLPKGSL